MSVAITVAPTGPVATKADSPSLPTAPEEIADAVASAYQAGAAVAHIHPRDQQRPAVDLDIGRPAIGLALGGDARAGLEDTLRLSRGVLAEGNLPLVERTVALARHLDLTLSISDDLGFASAPA